MMLAMHDNIRALTFDLDDTLWDNRPVLKAAEQSLYDWLADRVDVHATYHGPGFQQAFRAARASFHGRALCARAAAAIDDGLIVYGRIHHRPQPLPVSCSLVFFFGGHFLMILLCLKYAPIFRFLERNFPENRKQTTEDRNLKFYNKYFASR